MRNKGEISDSVIEHVINVPLNTKYVSLNYIPEALANALYPKTDEDNDIRNMLYDTAIISYKLDLVRWFKIGKTEEHAIRLVDPVTKLFVDPSSLVGLDTWDHLSCLFVRIEEFVNLCQEVGIKVIFDQPETSPCSRAYKWGASNSPEYKTKLHLQQDAILAVIKLKTYDPMNIPSGHKGTIKDICKQDYPYLFEGDSTFDTAWKSQNGKLWMLEDHHSFSHRGK